jgi:hypothetical protein
LDEIKEVHDKAGITGGFISSLDSVLYNDPMEGNLELAEIVTGTTYEIVPSINPLLPDIQRDFKMADNSFDYSTVRIYPSLHGYDYDCPEMTEFMDVAKEYRKSVIINHTFGDGRLDYLLKQKPADINKFRLLSEKNNGIRIVLCNIRLNEIVKIQDLLRNNDNIYFDMSELKHSMLAIKELEEIDLVKKIAFGSFYPMFDFSGAFMHFKGVEEKVVNEILERNIFKGGN